MEFRDYYQTLGVKRDATNDEIKKAYRKLARKYHPDVSKEPDAEQQMQAINEAWTVLSDPEKKSAYDQLGNNYRAGQNFRPPPDWERGFSFSNHSGGFDGMDNDFSDFFSSLFGDLRNRHHQTHTRFHARGEDQRAKVMIDIEDALHGGTRMITLHVPTTDEFGRTTMRERSLSVKIPKGVKEGQQIRLTGQGSPAAGGKGKNGDLFLEIQFRPHSHYHVEGRDIYLTVPVTPWELALGAVIKVNTPSGEVEVRVPEGSCNGRKLRLKERGIPGSPPGDLYLVLEVELPPADTPKAREIYEMMAQELAFNPRQK